MPKSVFLFLGNFLNKKIELKTTDEKKKCSFNRLACLRFFIHHLFCGNSCCPKTVGKPPKILGFDPEAVLKREFDGKGAFQKESVLK